MYKKALDLRGELNKFINSGERVLLKSNMVEGAEKGRSLTTQPFQLCDFLYRFKLNLTKYINTT